MTIYAFLITAALFFILGYEFHKERAERAADRRYTEMFGTGLHKSVADYPGKRVKTDADDALDGLDEDENTRMQEIKDELGGTILEHRRN